MLLLLEEDGRLQLLLELDPVGPHLELEVWWEGGGCLLLALLLQGLKGVQGQ